MVVQGRDDEGNITYFATIDRPALMDPEAEATQLRELRRQDERDLADEAMLRSFRLMGIDGPDSSSPEEIAQQAAKKEAARMRREEQFTLAALNAYRGEPVR
jgi:hypothetical protein